MQTVRIRFFDKEVGYKAAKFLKTLGYEVQTIGKTFWIDSFPAASYLILEVNCED